MKYKFRIVDPTRRLPWGAEAKIEAQARKRDGIVTSVSVGGATAYTASGEIDVPPSALMSLTVVRPSCA